MKRVLVVEDDPPMLRALGIGLRAFDFSVVAASDAGTALDLAARSAPEAVLLDLGLPENTNYLRVFMAALRRKLEADPASPRHLVTEPGLGYRFQP